VVTHRQQGFDCLRDNQAIVGFLGLRKLRIWNEAWVQFPRIIPRWAWAPAIPDALLRPYLMSIPGKPFHDVFDAFQADGRRVDGLGVVFV
jgi:hypothetical protein